jgi:hypothetical protein
LSQETNTVLKSRRIYQGRATFGETLLSLTLLRIFRLAYSGQPVCWGQQRSLRDLVILLHERDFLFIDFRTEITPAYEGSITGLAKTINIVRLLFFIYDVFQLFIEIRTKYVWILQLVNLEGWRRKSRDIFCSKVYEFTWRTSKPYKFLFSDVRTTRAKTELQTTIVIFEAPVFVVLGSLPVHSFDVQFLPKSKF